MRLYDSTHFLRISLLTNNVISGTLSSNKASWVSFLAQLVYLQTYLFSLMLSLITCVDTEYIHAEHLKREKQKYNSLHQ